MARLILEHGGRQIDVSEPGMMVKALNWDQSLHKSIVMTDESGQVIGAGDSIAAVYRSQPLIKAIKDGELKVNKSVGTPLRKSFRHSNWGARLERNLVELKKLERQFV